MAKIGNMFFGGRSSGNDGASVEVYSAVGFKLNKPADGNIDYTSEDKNWKVESQYSNEYIIARSLNPFPPEELITIGYEQIQRALDMAAYRDRTLHKTGNYDDPHWMIYKNDCGKLCLRYTDIIPWGMKSISEIHAYDRSGKLIQEDKNNNIRWEKPLRFYRFSQMATDIHQAYIFLYLGFESILNQIYPKDKISEVNWLKEALKKISQDKNINYQHQIGQLLPIDVDKAIVDFVKKQYTETRCRIFHAKREYYATTDDATIKPSDIANSYKPLLDLFRLVVNVYCDVGRSSCGVIEHQGFFHSMDMIHDSGFQVYFTDDPSPVSDFKTEKSPPGYPIDGLTVVNYQQIPERAEVEFVCTAVVDEKLRGKTMKGLYKEGTYEKGRFEVIKEKDIFKDGILLDGIDVFEYIQKIRLIDYGCPRTDYMEGTDW